MVYEIFASFFLLIESQKLIRLIKFLNIVTNSVESSGNKFMSIKHTSRKWQSFLISYKVQRWHFGFCKTHFWKFLYVTPSMVGYQKIFNSSPSRIANLAVSGAVSTSEITIWQFPMLFHLKSNKFKLCIWVFFSNMFGYTWEQLFLI